MIKLNLASGQMYIDGYVNIDDQSMYSDSKVDMKANIFSLRWPKGSVDEILLSHFMMYIHPDKAPLLLKRWFGWMKSGGIMIIETGDVKKIAKNILESSDANFINGDSGVSQLFGWGNTKGHKWAWCKETLELLLRDAGFIIVSSGNEGLHKRPDRDFNIICKKP